MAFDEKDMGRRIAAARTLRGMSQADLAAASGISINSIARYETGDTCPSLKNAAAIADALGVSAGYLAGRSELEREIQKEVV